MPLIINKMIDAQTDLLVWESIEDEEFMRREIIHPDSISLALKNIINPKRIKEKLATTLLFQTALKTSDSIEIAYDEHGKPYLASFPLHISISHTGNYVSIITSKNKIPGIDIETIRDRIVKIADKFINKEEFSFIEEATRIEQMHVIWGAKECIYKIYGKKGVDFKKNMKISSFNYLKDSYLRAKIEMPTYQKEMTIHFKKISNCMLCWGLADNE